MVLPVLEVWDGYDGPELLWVWDCVHPGGAGDWRMALPEIARLEETAMG